MPTKGPPLFAVGAFWAFVLGGLAFGYIFISNWHALGQREQPRLVVAAGPVTVTMPVTLSPPAPMGGANTPARPAAPPSSGLATVVKNVLPEWIGKERVNILLLGIDKRDD